MGAETHYFSDWVSVWILNIKYISRRRSFEQAKYFWVWYELITYTLWSKSRWGDNRIHKEYYLSVINRLKNPQLWANNSWFLHAFTIMYHIICVGSSRLYCQKLDSYCSPDFAPCDFWLLRKGQYGSTIWHDCGDKNRFEECLIPTVSRTEKSVGKSAVYRTVITLKDDEIDLEE